MKFLYKINLNYLIIFSITVAVVSVVGYFILQKIILDETRENLLGKELLIKRHILETGEMPNLYPIIEVEKINRIYHEEVSFKKIFVNDELENEAEPYLEYSHELKIDNSFYSIKIRQSVFESKDLILLLTFSFVILLSLAFGISFFITKKTNRTIWKDFEQNIREIESFGFSDDDNLSLISTNIEEFDRLNAVLDKLTGKLKKDYRSLKEFTESASHEIQTPLSVALLNLEEVLQQEIKQGTFQKIITSIRALNKLSALNKSLILLTKIENKQFEAEQSVSFIDLVNHKLKEFESLFESKNLVVDLKTEEDFVLKMNLQIAEILLNNILSNAINHNVENGTIQIFISEEKFSICNTGPANTLNNENIFDRFVKGNSSSSGLGLAIVKKICDSHYLEIIYKQQEMHCFTILKKK